MGVSEERVFSQTLDNGLVLVCEEMDAVESAAVTLLVPAGASNDPAQAGGSASVLSDLVFRGAGDRSSRELSDHLDSLGLQRSESAGTHHTCLSAATLARNLEATLEAYADVVRRPLLPDDELSAAKALATQHIDALEDEPRQKVLIELRRRHYPYPLGRNALGAKDEIEGITAESIRADLQRRYLPNGTIIGIAGKVRWDDVRKQITALFDDWASGEAPTLPEQPAGPAVDHIEHETTQTQIGIAYPSVPVTHEQYYAARLSVAALSGGMSGRLFTEVREKRSLCYAVYAAHLGLKDRASVLCYAGTTNERAQETLDVTLGELRRLADGVDEDELARGKVGLKSALVMQGESSTARSGAVAGDWFSLGRVRSLDEITGHIDATTVADVNGFLKSHAPGPFTIVTLGPKALEVSC
jgi:predicted Zn-dependent peptidase